MLLTVLLNKPTDCVLSTAALQCYDREVFLRNVVRFNSSDNRFQEYKF